MAITRLVLGLACLGVFVCAGCGSSFSAGDVGMGGDAEAGAASSDGGSSSSAGSSSAGASGETSAGATGMGGSTSGGSTSSGGSGTAGNGGSSAGAGGSVGHGGAAGGAGTAGGGGAPDCKTLQAEYAPLLEKARVCDKGSTNQCSASSKLPSGGSCGCPVLVNDKSDATTLAQKKYKQLQDNNCLNTGVICNIACVSANNASCEQQTSGMGTAYVCTASAAIN